jgi:hypothetical protein
MSDELARLEAAAVSAERLADPDTAMSFRRVATELATARRLVADLHTMLEARSATIADLRRQATDARADRDVAILHRNRAEQMVAMVVAAAQNPYVVIDTTVQAKTWELVRETHPLGALYLRAREV